MSSSRPRDHHDDDDDESRFSNTKAVSHVSKPFPKYFGHFPNL